MKGLSTKISILALALTLFGWSQVTGQSHTLTFSSPADVSSFSFATQIAGFGPDACQIEEFSGELILVSDSLMGTLACDTVLNDLTGKIAVIDRGSCGFVDKANNAIAKGAIGMLVISNDGDNIFSMGGDDPSIMIPSFMVSQNDGNLFRNFLDQNIMATFTRDDVAYPADGRQILWGANQGEGDFDGGLSGWSTVTLTCGGNDPMGYEVWRWDVDGIAVGHCGSGQISSPSVCNGAMVFESDFADSGQTTDCPNFVGTRTLYYGSGCRVDFSKY